MQKWRWDQGRLGYFKFTSIRNIAISLEKLDGSFLNGKSDPLRNSLTAMTGLPFSPSSYTVWRNYKRVFESALLATTQNRKMVITDVCRWLASSGGVTVDDYLGFLIPRFSFSAPMFDDYDVTEKPYFYFCAVIKLLLASYRAQEQSTTVADIASLVVGNNCDGTEKVEHYKNLKPTGFSFRDDESRQVRESLIFLSQLSFLKWHRNRLFLDVLPGDTDSIRVLSSIATPISRSRVRDKAGEILSLAEITQPQLVLLPENTARRQPADVTFTEGKRSRVTHLRTERSPYLRTAFFDAQEQPYLCDMCSFIPQKKYPWVENILEIHHLLPLSSEFDISNSGTSLNDVVALCPNCHRSVHIYYKQWLNTHNQDDFSSKCESVHVYQSAKQEVIDK